MPQAERSTTPTSTAPDANAARGFRCTRCGHCCRTHVVPITHLDLLRLERYTAGPAARLVEWLPPDAIDMTGEPESFVELDAGRRLLVLARRGAECTLLDARGQCSVHPARPAACSAYPYALPSPNDASTSPSSSMSVRTPSTPTEPKAEPKAEPEEQRRLELLPLGACEAAWDGDPGEPSRLAECERVRRELVTHVELVQRWNRRQRRRTLLGRKAQSASACEAFLRSAALDADPRAAPAIPKPAPPP